MPSRRLLFGAAWVAATALVTSAGNGTASVPAAAGPAAVVRVDSVGFGPAETKTAYLMTKAAVSGASYAVLDSDGDPVLTGTVSAPSRGAWSDTYRHVYPIDISAVTDRGRYAMKVSGPVSATSQRFRIQSARRLWGDVVANGVSFFQTQRDGRTQLAGPLHRKPSHRHDAHAGVYALPHFVHPTRSDRIAGSLHRVAGHRALNAAGGWFDAGDYLKFTHTAAYADIMLFAANRALTGSAPRQLTTEARYGERWLSKMWDQKHQTLYLQVGIGSGNNRSIYGDHDLWRLPQADDHDTRHRDRFAASHRPVFRAAPPGRPISPNLAGRVAAAFALAAQEEGPAHARRAAHELKLATTVYSLADTKSPPEPLLTAAPVEYYPEDSWRDDMALGGAEIALAQQALGKNAAAAIRDSAHFIKAYVHHDAGSDTLNLYDTSALAERDWLLARDHTGTLHWGLSPRHVSTDIRRQVRVGQRRSSRDPFRAGGFYDEFDVDSHTFGMIAIATMYGDRHSYDKFATAQRNWLFGANPWGASFMVGEGTNYPRCMQHQVANLSGSRDGTPPVDVGAVVNGPNDAGLFRGGLGSRQDGMRRCPKNGNDPYAPFTGRGSRYLDDVRAWQTSEPAIDMTATAIFAAASQESIAASG